MSEHELLRECRAHLGKIMDSEEYLSLSARIDRRLAQPEAQESMEQLAERAAKQRYVLPTDEQIRAVAYGTSDQPEAAPVAWRCFHCDEVFADRPSAQDHFGTWDHDVAACQIKAGAERSMLSALRVAEDDAAAAWAAIHNESTDAAKAYHAQAGRHRTQLQAAEELGFERGLTAQLERASPPSAPDRPDVPVARLNPAFAEPSDAPDRRVRRLDRRALPPQLVHLAAAPGRAELVAYFHQTGGGNSDIWEQVADEHKHSEGVIPLFRRSSPAPDRALVEELKAYRTDDGSLPLDKRNADRVIAALESKP